MSDPTFVTTRVFDAPRELVYTAWTDTNHLLRWFGPKGFSLLPGINSDFRPGGTYHYGMRTPDGHDMWGKWVFRELKRPERIVLVTSFSDEKAGISRHPMSPTWPLETLSTVLLDDLGGKTSLTLRWTPIKATEEERTTFAAGMSSMEKGWGGTFEQLTAYLATQTEAKP